MAKKAKASRKTKPARKRYRQPKIQGMTAEDLDGIAGGVGACYGGAANPHCFSGDKADYNCHGGGTFGAPMAPCSTGSQVGCGMGGKASPCLYGFTVS